MTVAVWRPRSTLIAIGLAAVLAGPVPVRADWEPDPASRRQVSAAAEVSRFRAEIPRSAEFFDQAYGYAVLTSITRVGFGFGGAYGRGVVVEGNQVVANASYWQFTSGIQAGAKNFSMIVFFRDRQTFEAFRKNELQFQGQAGLSVATWGASGTPAYNEGVAIITRNRFGLMYEFTISGAKFRYLPLPDD